MDIKQRRLFKHLQRHKYRVSSEFLSYNLNNIRQFIFYARTHHAVLRKYAVRDPKSNRVFLKIRIRSALFDPKNVKMFRERRRNVKKWSKANVSYLKSIGRITEYVETEVYDVPETTKTTTTTTTKATNNLEVSKQMKEQLELLKSGKRLATLIDKNVKENITKSGAEAQEQETTTTLDTHKEQLNVADDTEVVATTKPQIFDLATTLSKAADNTDTGSSGGGENIENAPPNNSQRNSNSVRAGAGFLDRLMTKVRVRNFANESNMPTNAAAAKNQLPLSPQSNPDDDVDFLGFDESELQQPGMMLTPLVPASSKSETTNKAAFVSEFLNNFMLENNLCERDTPTAIAANNDEEEEEGGEKTNQIISLEGLVTPECEPPHMDMPAVPESLQKLRTVAERRQYLQKFSKTHKMVLINNEANIYRELQRKVRQQKVKAASMLMLQTPGTQMPFTPSGWAAASFVATENNKYYYQTINVDGEIYRLSGSMGNNEQRDKPQYKSKVSAAEANYNCYAHCLDAQLWRSFQIIKSNQRKALLDQLTLTTDFRPCPLSHKPLQKPADEETAAMLLTGGSIAVVSMPKVELLVYPEIGKPLNEIAKRYLQYILPHHDISREWAKFSVSTMQMPRTVREAEEASAKLTTTPKNRKSFTFAIPYINDRSQILVRRIVDRSEKLDETFQLAQEDDSSMGLKDFSFRAALEEHTDDADLVKCADMLSDLINAVTISCTENSFTKEDPDGFYAEQKKLELKSNADAKLKAAAAAEVKRQQDNKIGRVPHSKQNRLRMELKRLNATIIETAPKCDKDEKPCPKPHCQLGCVCDSIAGTFPMREHCGKAACVLECHCKTSIHSRILRVETDGRGISNEDAFMLRRQATARLAPMEKEFTSTVVLTQNETLLINESQRDKKRRCTKAPKRYEDYAETDDDFLLRTPPKKPQTPTATSPTTTTNAAAKSSLVAIEAHDSSSSTTTTTTTTSSFIPKIIELEEEICSITDTDFEQLKHCTVQLRRLPDMSNVATFCMVHQLYKCFCGAEATEGKPVILEKEELNITTNQHSVGKKSYAEIAAKARYSFDKVEKMMLHEDHKIKSSSSPACVNEKISKSKVQQEDAAQVDLLEVLTATKETAAAMAKPKQKSNHVEQREQSSSIKSIKRINYLESIVIHDYFEAKPNICRRAIIIPTKTYTTLNRKRRAKILAEININETLEKQNKLMCNIEGAIRYYRTELELKRKMQREKSLRNAVIVLPDDDDDDDQVPEKSVAVMVHNKTTPPVPAPTPTPHTVTKKKQQVQQLQSDDVLLPAQKKRRRIELDSSDATNTSTNTTTATTTTAAAKYIKLNKKFISTESLLKSKSTKTATTPPKLLKPVPPPPSQAEKQQSSCNKILVPKIASCYSLNNQAQQQQQDVQQVMQQANNLNYLEMPQQQQQHNDDATESSLPADISINNNASTTAATATSSHGDDNVILEQSQQFRESYHDVVRSMNGLVSKKMQDIDLALQRDSRVIPQPNEEILCIIRWTNFLGAFESGYVYIWDVKMRNYSYLVATLNNLMPIICGAIGVVNILGISADRQQFLARMLMQRIRCDFTERLAIVMQGRKQFWLVKGFLFHQSDNACTKPTPQTHPILTTKINTLCTLLVKQRLKEVNKRTQKNNTNAAPPPPPPPSPPAPEPTQTATPVAPSMAIIAATATNTTQQQMPTAATEQLKLQRKTQFHTISNQIKHNILRKQNANANGGVNAITEYETMPPGDIKTNIEFRQITKSDTDELMLPEKRTTDHRWLVLDLYADFSHIFLPAFRDMVSLDRLQKVLKISRDRNILVKMKFFENRPYDAVVTPNSPNKIYFGPLSLTMPPPVLVLLQSVDGNIMLREVYQKEHNIQVKQEERTKAFYVWHINGQIRFDVPPAIVAAAAAAAGADEEQLMPATVAVTPQSSSSSTSLYEESDDDDCMIIEDDDCDTAATATTPPPPEKKMKTDAAATDSDALSIQQQQQQRLNFSIQTAENRLQILPINNGGVAGIKPTVQQSNLAMQQQQQPLLIHNTESNSKAHETGFMPLFGSNEELFAMQQHLLISTTTTTTAETADKINEAYATSSPQITTYLTPHVKMTPTTEPATFIEPTTTTTDAAAAQQPEKINRISINTNVVAARNVNNSLQKLFSPTEQTAADMEKKTTVGCTTITRLNDGGSVAGCARAATTATDAATGACKTTKKAPINESTKKPNTTTTTPTSVKITPKNKTAATSPPNMAVANLNGNQSIIYSYKRTATGALKTAIPTTTTITSNSKDATILAEPTSDAVTAFQASWQAQKNKIVTMPTTAVASVVINKPTTTTTKTTTTTATSSNGTIAATVQQQQKRLSLPIKRKPTAIVNAAANVTKLSTTTTAAAAAAKPALKLNIINAAGAGATTKTNNNIANNNNNSKTTTTTAATEFPLLYRNVANRTMSTIKLVNPATIKFIPNNKPAAAGSASVGTVQTTKSPTAANAPTALRKLALKRSTGGVGVGAGTGTLQSGYIFAPNLPMFDVKTNNNEYAIRVPGEGIMRIRGMNSVNAFLNQHLSKLGKHTDKLPALWKFVARNNSDTNSNAEGSNKTAAAATPPIAKLNRIEVINDPILIDD